MALALVAPSVARGATLQSEREKARQLAAEVAALDARIGSAVQQYAQATTALQAVREEIRDVTKLQAMARTELEVARTTLAERAVAIYKHGYATTMDAVFSADGFGDLVRGLAMVRSVAQGDREVLRSVERTQRELADQAKTLEADRRTAERLVGQRSANVQTIRARLADRQALLEGVRAEIRRLVDQHGQGSSAPLPSAEPGGGGGSGGGKGRWWPLIQAAAADNRVSARGMYKLMMIESGGSATIVGPGGFYGLFQYHPATWKGSWNPYRRHSITDGAAQIRATALALRLGYGHAWWDPSYSWAFSGR